MKKIFQFCLFLTIGIAVQHLRLFANGNAHVPVTSKEVSRIMNGLYPFNTIEFEYMLFYSGGERKMEKILEKGVVRWNRKTDCFQFSCIKENTENVLRVTEEIAKDGRLYTMARKYRKGKEFVPDGNALDKIMALNILPCASSYQPLSMEKMLGAWNIERKALHDFFIKKGITPADLKPKEKYVEFSQEGHVFAFDRATGHLLSNRQSYKDSNGKTTFEKVTEFSDYEQINGFWFPLNIKITQLHTGNIYVEQFQIKKESLKINGDIRKEDLKFSFPIPKGTYVFDKVTGTRYRSTGTDGAIPIEDIGKELDDIFEEAEKRR